MSQTRNQQVVPPLSASSCRWTVTLLLFACSQLSCSHPALADESAEKRKSLFDGKSLAGWEPISKARFEDGGEVTAKDGVLTLSAGRPGTGIRWKGDFPKQDYEVTFEAMRVTGGDFFCGMTFPHKQETATLILGGWGGWLVGLSCLDGVYAVDNETGMVFKFKNNTWYRVRLRVTEESIDAWIDDHHVVELEAGVYDLTVSREMRSCAPFGIATWNTTGAIRNLKLKQLTP